MTKVEIIANIADQLGVSRKQAELAYNCVFDAITDALANGEKVVLSGFGQFDIHNRAAREGVNPRTGEKIQVPASKTPTFKAGKSLKDSVNK